MTTERTYAATVIAEIMGISKRAVNKRAVKETWTSIKNGKTNEYFLHSLPAEIQNKIIAANPLYNNKEGETSGKVVDPLPPAVPAVRSPSLPVVTIRDLITPNMPVPDLKEWANLPEVSRGKGYDLLLIVNRMRELLAKTPRKEKTPAVKAFSRQVGYHDRSLYRYLGIADKALKSAQASGEDTIMAQIQALAPKWGQTRDRITAFDKNAVAYALSLYASGELRTMQEVHNRTISMALGNNWQTGTYESLCSYLHKLDNATTKLARVGKKAFEADNLIKILRNYDEIPPNFMWCGDHHIFDVFVKYPDGKGGWIYKRPWLTSWMDMRSRSLMGWCISFKPNSRTIAMALAHAISPKDDPDFPQCGLPSSVYIDNGKDYRAKYLNGEEIEIGKIDYPDIIQRFAALGIDPFYIDLTFDPEQNAWVKKHGDKFLEIKGVRVGGVYARLNISQRYATAYHPWAKPIERFHRTLVQSFSRELPGWCGSGHEQRPEKLDSEMKSGHAILTIDEFCDRFYGWVVNKYHKTAHRGHGMNGRTPNEVFRSLMPEPQPCDPALLDFALLRKDRVKIHNWGFNLEGRQFELDLPVNLQGGHILNILIGTWATVFFDYDFKTVRVYRDGKWYCNARPLNRASFVAPNDATMTDKLKLASYQKRAAAGTIRLIQDHPAAQEEVNEARMLLELTREATTSPSSEVSSEIPGGSPPDLPVDGLGLTDCAAPSFPEPEPDDAPIYLTRAARYEGEILPLLASGAALTEAQQKFRQEFEAEREYLDSRDLYDAKLDYERYLAGGTK